MKTSTSARRKGAIPTRTSLALAVVVALSIGASNAGAATSAAGSYATVAQATTLQHADAVLGALPMKRPIHVEVALKLRNKDALDAFVANNVKDQARGVAPQLMTSDRFLADHAPTQQQARAVAAYLTGMGFQNVTIAPNRLLVSADGTALTAGVAFQTSFAQVRTRDGRIAYANTQDAHVPVILKDIVLAVIGLQTVQQPHAMVARHTASAQPMTNPRVGHNPMEFGSIYGGTGVATAAGVTIGLITQGDLTQTITDLNTFTAQNSLATVTTQTVNTGGTGSDTSLTSTWDLESQDIVGMAGGQVGKLVFYNVPTLTDSTLTADLNAAVSANAAKIVSVAYSECETVAQSDGSAAADDAIFETAVAQGQTLSVEAGDAGADPCDTGSFSTSWPASSQYVVAVGGTSLVATTTSYETETVWNTAGFNPSTGGGPSAFEPMPSWQQEDVSVHYPSVTTRAVPDIAFDADSNSGAKIVVDGAPAQLGGTALSASLFAGLWARAIAVRGADLGFAGPSLYEELLPGDLHDVTRACNGSDGEGGSTCAQSGYDLASGLGSINLGKALNHLTAQLLGNTGFETGKAAPWFASSGVISNNASEPPHNGSWDAWMDGKGITQTQTLWQPITIPSGYTKATLAFYLHIDTAETTTQLIHDHLTVRVTDSSGNELSQLAEYSNLDAASAYVLHSFNLAPYIGQAIEIRFTGSENGSLQTSFVLDDVTLDVK